jgi:hypothetical protein
MSLKGFIKDNKILLKIIKYYIINIYSIKIYNLLKIIKY